MKKIAKNTVYCVMVFLLYANIAFAQTGNFVKTQTYLDENGTNAITSIQFYDGLGRPSIQATNGLSNIGKYTYSLTEYDCLGRESASWYPVDGDHTIDLPTKAEIMSMSQATYSDNSAFTLTEYDGLNRKIALSQGGDLWTTENKNDSTHYSTNGYEEVIKYQASASGITQAGFWPSGTLSVETNIDEDGHWRKTYKNVLGDIVLEDVGGAKTYYVYNNRSLLSYVLTPEYQQNNDIDKYTYKYEYDNLDRVSSKCLPGCAPVIFRYDTGDRILITQDGMLREKGLYRYTFYDSLGRVAIQGTCGNYDESKLSGNLTVEFHPGNQGILGSGYAFVDNSAANGFISSVTIEAAYYYDDYGFLNQTHSNAKYKNFANLDDMRPSDATLITGENACNAIGSKTGEFIATSDGGFLFSSYFYDRKGRLVEDHHSTLEDKVYKVFTDYSFTDKPTQVTKVIPHSDSNTSTSTITTSFEYNQHNDQLQSTKVKLGTNGTEHVVSDLTYDDLGRIASESRPDINETINYYYDLHGWTDSIAGRYFTEHLYYADGTGTPCYNGDISVQEWKASDDSLRVYKFTYNDRDMLKDAVYDNLSAGDSHHGRYDERSITYNNNGAMTRLFRKGMRNNESFGYIDQLTFNYDGSQLQRVNDGISATLSRNGAFEYQNNNRSGNDFEYNTAGMLVKDRDKGIERIVYNNIGLVDSIIFESGAKVAYTYSMSGEKLRVRHYAAPETMVSTQPSDNGLVPYLPGGSLISYDEETYYGADVVESNSFSGFTRTLPSYKYYFGNGYISFSSRFIPLQSAFYYYSKDHLGNVRSVVKANSDGTGSELQVTHYYPFGGIIADISTGRNVQNRLYNGKELDTSNNLWWYDYGARQYDPTAPRFITPDPLAEKYYGWNMYGYCRNNPIKRIDVDGLFDWENISAWNNYPVIAVFPIERDNAMQIDYEAAQSVNVPIITVSDVSDLGNALNALPLNGNNFESISINSHGSFNKFQIGSETIDISSDLGLLKNNLSGKKVFIGACNVGQNELFVQQIAEDTGSQVIAAQHKIPAGYTYDGSNSLNYGPILEPKSSQYTKSDGIKTSTITNFTIDKNIGMSWDDKLFFE